MNEKNYLNAKRAIRIVTALTFIVAFFELFFAFTQYQKGMTIGDVVSYVTNKHHIYLLLLIIANIGLFPSALLLYKENGISLKDEIYDKKHWERTYSMACSVLLLLRSSAIFTGGSFVSFPVSAQQISQDKAVN